MEPQLTAGEATRLAFNTLFAQFSAIKAMATGTILSQLEAFEMILDRQPAFIIEAYNSEVDNFDGAMSLVETSRQVIAAKDDEILAIKQQLSAVKSQLDDEIKHQQMIVKKSEQIATQRDAYRKEAEELRPVKSERDRLKKQVERNKESNEKLQAQVTKLEQDKSRLKRDNLMASQSVIKMKGVCNAIQQALFYDGLAPERIETINGVTYYFYRKPLIKTMMQIDDFEVSRQHQYFFTIQTSIGTHRDIIPGEGGTYGINKAQPLPKEIFAIMQDEFSKETLFQPTNKPLFATERLQKLFEEIDACLKDAA